MRPSLSQAARAIAHLPQASVYGRVAAAHGSLIEVEGLLGHASIGAHIRIEAEDGPLDAEITGLDRDVAHCLPFCEPRGLATGAKAHLCAGQDSLRPSQAWLGRMVDGLGRPVDGKGRAGDGRHRAPDARRAAARRRPRPRRPPGRDRGARARSVRAFCAWGSASACSRGRAWASPCCSRCWRAGRSAMSR
jgi:flagellum-specific ATP synthase